MSVEDFKRGLIIFLAVGSVWAYFLGACLHDIYKILREIRDRLPKP